MLILSERIVQQDCGNVTSADRLTSAHNEQGSEGVSLDTLCLSDETLVPDKRADFRPSQMVEIKLIARLRSAFLPVSHILTRGIYSGCGRR